jgi:hypothetical protein
MKSSKGIKSDPTRTHGACLAWARYKNHKMRHIVSSGWPAVLQAAFGAIVAAFGAIVASGIAGVVAFVVYKKQQKEQRRNERIKWADDLRERILEVNSTATWFHWANWKVIQSPQGDGSSWNSETQNYTIKLTDSITRIGLMLDPDDTAHAELIKALESVRSASFTRDTNDAAQFKNAHESLMKSARVVLKSDVSGG